MERYFSISLRSELINSLCLLFVPFFMVSCNNRSAVNEGRMDICSDSVFSSHILANHIRFSRKVKDVPLEGVDKSNLLVYRYCYETCDKCVEEDLCALLDIQTKIGKDAVWVLPSFPESRNTKIRFRNELRNFNYINIAEKEDMPVDECTGLAMRYFIFYPKGQGFSYVFFPTKGHQELTQSFFNIVLEEFNKH